MRPVRVHDREQHEVLCKILASIGQLKDAIMTSLQDFKDSFAKVDVATTAIAERLRTLSQNIGSMTKDEEDAAKAQLDALATTLEGMAATPDNPVPTPVPEEPAP